MNELPKMPEIAEAGSGPRPELSSSVLEAERTDEEMYATMSPVGKFSSRGLNILVQATNKLLPLFAQEPNYPMFSTDLKTLPTDFVRILSMFSNASRDASTDERITPDLVVSIDDIKDDSGLVALAAKINLLAKSKDFKNFLKEPAPVESKEEIVEEKKDSPEDIDALFMSRM